MTALVRGACPASRDGLTNVIADLCQPKDLAAVLPGHDAVISCLGHRPNGNISLVKDAAEAMVEAMQQARAKCYLTIRRSALPS